MTGAVNTGAGTLTLSSGGSLILYAPLTGGTVDLVSNGILHQNPVGIITATTLTGSSTGAVTLQAQNAIANLGAFNSHGASFALTDSLSLDVTDAVNAGILTLTTLGSMTETGGGTIAASLLNISAGTGIDLDSAGNNIAAIGTDHTASGPNIVTR